MGNSVIRCIKNDHDFTKALDSGEQIDDLFACFSKVFDKAPHERLYKLLCCGINLLNWIKSFTGTISICS